MLHSGLILLPLLAFAIVIEGTWLNRNHSYKYRSSKFQRYYRYRVLVLRALIVTLVVSAFLSKRVALGSLPPLAEGVILTTIMMLPVLAYILILEMRDGDQNIPKPASTGRTDNRELKTEIKTNSTQGDNTIPVLDVNKLAPAPPKPSMASKPMASKPIAQPTHFSANSGSTPARNQYQESADTDSDLDQTLNFDHTLSVDDQLKNIDSTVNHLNIGSDEFPTLEGDSAPRTVDEPTISEQMAASVIKSVQNTESELTTLSKANNLPAVRQTEIVRIISGLQKDKLKLQKLVIAQKAVIESEKQAHLKTRGLTKDAVTLMRRAREGQRFAEKVARRERSERKRLQADNEKILQQLENALSIRVNNTADV